MHGANVGGLPSSPKGAKNLHSFESLRFLRASATCKLTLFPATLQLLSKHLYKSLSVLWWIRGTSSLPQPRAAHISKRKLELGVL